MATPPRTTEAERMGIQRIGQDIFRGRLLAFRRGHCPLTGITEPALLRASHITPWADRGSDADRLDVMNGLLLSAPWDATRAALATDARLPLADGHCRRLASHRARLVP